VPNGSLNLVSKLLPTGYIKVVEAGQAGYANSLLDRDTNNFAPRLGVAWRPFSATTVIRAGVGLYYDNAPPDPALGATVPFLIAQPAFTNTATNPLRFPFIFPSSVAGPTTIAIPRGSRKDLRVPLTGQYTLTIEHQRWDMGFRATYTGTNTRQGIYRRDLITRWRATSAIWNTTNRLKMRTTVAANVPRGDRCRRIASARIRSSNCRSAKGGPG
jgi:hypothetical protein